MMIVPEAANIPPTPWQTEILAPGSAGGVALGDEGSGRATRHNPSSPSEYPVRDTNPGCLRLAPP